MSETESRKAQLLSQARPLLPYLAAAIALLAVWLAWNGWKQTQDGVRRDRVTLARDATVQQTATTIGAELKRLETRLQDADVQEALQAADLDAAGKALAADWPRLEHAEIRSPDLAAAYGALSGSGFGRLAAMEAALAEGKPVSWIIRDEGKPALALAAPAMQDDAIV